jgi:tyrosine-protein kinase
VQQQPETPTLERFVDLLRRRFPLIALCMLVVAGAAFAVSERQTKKYTATSSLVFGGDSLRQQVVGLSGASSINNPTALLAQQANDLELVKGGQAATNTARAIGHGMTVAKLLGSLNIAGQGESGVIDITATSVSPVLAARMANIYAQQFVEEQKVADRSYFKSALALVHKQLAALSPQQRVGVDGLQLQNRAQTLSMLAELDYGNAQVAQRALPPSSPSSPRTSRNTGLGLFVGLLVGVGLALLLERLDRRIRDPRELESVYRLPLLGSVPRRSELARLRGDRHGRRRALRPAQAEAFRMIRAHMRLSKASREARTIAIASGTRGEGKTTVARHLAEAAANAGSRALLLEADLRGPTLARALDLRPGPGLIDVLNGDASIDRAVQRVSLQSSPAQNGTGGRTLDVLVAGAPSFNAVELLESAAMDALLEQVRAVYDLVVIDTPAVTVVSDALPLLSRVDGIVVVGFVGRTRRHEAERLRQVLEDSGARLLGAIANGVSPSRSPGAYPGGAGGFAAVPAVSGDGGASAPADREPVAAADA